MGENDTSINTSRISSLEKHVARMRETVAKIEAQADTHKELTVAQDHETRIRNIEIDMANNTLVLRAVKFLTMTLVSTALLVGGTALTQGWL